MDNIVIALGFYRDNVKQEVINCKDCVKNWADITISLTRKNYTGVVREITNEFEFVGEVRDKILSYYETDYLSAQVRVNIYQLNESWEYDLIYQGFLDFSTIEYDGISLNINSKDNSLASLINANSDTVYDIDCADLVEEKQLYYSRPNVYNTVQWTTDDNLEDTTEAYNFQISKTLNIPESTSAIDFYIPIPLAYMETNAYRLPFIYQDQDGDVVSSTSVSETTGCLQVTKTEASFRLYADFQAKVNAMPAGAIVTASIGNTNFNLASTSVSSTLSRIRLNASIINMKGRTIGLFFKVTVPAGLKRTESINITYHSRSEKEGYFDRGSILFAEAFSTSKDMIYNCIKPINLLNALVEKMNTNNLEYQCVIEDTNEECVLLPAEIINKTFTPRVHTSFSDFAKFMECCFGFTYTIGDKVIRFQSKSNVFVEDVAKSIESYSEYNFSQDTSLIYSSVKAGYNTDDNTREFNITNEYSTGLSLTDNTFELVSPYRGDTYGVEQAVQEAESESGSSTEYKENDTIFVIRVDSGAEYYTIRRDVKTFYQERPPIIGQDSLSIKRLQIINRVSESYEIGFGNYYITSIRTVVSDGVTYIRVAINVVFGTDDNYYTMPEYEKSILVPATAQGVQTFSNDEIIITADWSNLDNRDFEDNELLLCPISLTAFDLNMFNYRLSPQNCIKRNDIMVTPCALNLKATTCNRNIIFYDGDVIYNSEDINFSSRDLTVNTLTFTTDENILPEAKNSLVEVVIGDRAYRGWLTNTSKNIGKNEQSEYNLILSTYS